MKKYVLIAGVNGAGKSTLYDDLTDLHGMRRVCLDEIVRNFGGNWQNPADVIHAGNVAIAMIRDSFKQELSFNQETTLCGKTILQNIDKALSLGYYVELHFIGLSSPAIAVERVRNRVQHGGHGIRYEDIQRRYYESLQNLKHVIHKCDQVVIYDNSIQFMQIAFYQNGVLRMQSSVLPEWYKKFINE